MINPISFLWRQFCGPQVVGIMQGLYAYFKESYDTTLEYFRNMSIASATSEHLTVRGALGGVARPLVPIPDEDYLVFSNTYGYIQEGDPEGYLTQDPEDAENLVVPDEYFSLEDNAVTLTPNNVLIPGTSNPEELLVNASALEHLVPDSNYPSTHGFSAQAGQGVIGGKFSEIRDTFNYDYVSDAIFRKILKALSNSKGYLGSLVVLDDILAANMQNEVEPAYTFEWAPRTSGMFTAGDCKVLMGSATQYFSAYELYAELNLLGKTVYFPNTKVYVEMIE